MNCCMGKYRGTVEDNADPQKRGRMKVRVPAVVGANRDIWAEPCVPYAGPGVGAWAIPPVGSHVWVEFEGGNPDYPIWTGCFWSEGETVPGGGKVEQKVFQTAAGTITLDDSATGGITIETSGMKIRLADSGIEIDNGRGARLTLNQSTISLNSGALEVT